MNLIPSHVYTDYINNHKNNTQILYETVAEKSRQVKEKVIDKINEKRSNQDLIIGCQIFKKSNVRSSKIKNKFLGPFTLKEILPNNKIRIENPKTKKQETVHINEIKIKNIVSDGAGLPGQM